METRVSSDDEIIYSLQRKGIQFDNLRSLILIPNDLIVGIKLWGRIDYLKKLGWSWRKFNKH